MSALSLGVSLGPVRGWAGLAAVLLLTVSSAGPPERGGTAVGQHVGQRPL